MKDPYVVDATGLLCPLPVLKLRKSLTRVQVGQVVQLLTDDMAAIIDVPHFCTESGHAICDTQTETAPYQFWVKRQK